MQTLARDGHDAEQIYDLVTGDAVEIDAGLELLSFDRDPDNTTDLTEYLKPEGSSVMWQARAGIHRTCRLQLTTDLDWPTALLRPYMLMSIPGVTGRFDTGEFLCHRPLHTTTEEDEPVWEIQGFDRLEFLNTPIGRTYRAAAGTTYVGNVVDLIREADPTADPTILIESGAEDVELAKDRTWDLDERHTYLAVINGLLLAVGYRAVWVDHRGAYRISRYIAAIDRAPEWTYDTTGIDTIVHPNRTEDASWWDVPNVWVIIRDRPAAGVTGTTTDGTEGLLVITNQNQGPTSIDARGGTVRRRIVRVDAADPTALVAQATDIVAADQQITRKRRISVDPNPLHSHLDVVQLVDDELQGGKALCTSWTLPLDGTPMPLDLEVVSLTDAL